MKNKFIQIHFLNASSLKFWEMVGLERKVSEIGTENAPVKTGFDFNQHRSKRVKNYAGGKLI
jgi:hypothetical protein